MTMHESRRFHSIRIIPIRRRRSGERLSLERSHKPRSRSAESNCRRYSRCCSMQEKQEYCYDQGFDFIQRKENTQLAWQAKELTYVDHPTPPVDERVLIETMDLEALEQRYYLKRSNVSSYPSQQEVHLINKVPIEHKASPSEQSNEHLSRRTGAARRLSCNDFGGTGIMKIHCKCCEFGKCAEGTLDSDAPSRRRQLYVTNISQTEHEQLGDEDYCVNKMTTRSHKCPSCFERRDFAHSSDSNFYRNAKESKLLDLSGSKAGISNSRYKETISGGGEFGLEDKIAHVISQQVDSNVVEGNQNMCIDSSFAVEEGKGKTVSEKNEVLHARKQTERRMLKTEAFPVDQKWEDKRTYINTNRKKGLCADTSCCGGYKNSATGEQNTEKMRQSNFEKRSSKMQLQQSPKFDEILYSGKCRKKGHECSQLVVKLHSASNDGIDGHRAVANENISSGRAISAQASFRNPPQSKGKTVYERRAHHRFSSSENDRDLTEVFIKPAQIEARENISKQTDSEFVQMERKVETIERTTKDSNMYREEMSESLQPAAHCNDKIIENSVAQTTFESSRQVVKVTWDDNVTNRASLKARQNYSESVEQKSDEMAEKMGFEESLREQENKTHCTAASGKPFIGGSQMESTWKNAFSNDDNKNFQDLEDFQQQVNRQRNLGHTVAADCDENVARNTHCCEEGNFGDHHDSSYDPQKKLARERARRDAPHVHSVSGNSNGNPINQTGMSHNGVLRVNEMREAPDVRNALHGEPVLPFQHRTSNWGRILEIAAVDFNIERNTIAHHTEQYEVANVHPHRLVCRRGQPIVIFLKTHGNYDPQVDTMTIVFTNETAKSRAELPVKNEIYQYEDVRRDEWEARIRRQFTDSITVDISIPYDCAIGIWEVNIECRRFGFLTSIVGLDAPIYILFNPWNREDETYYPLQDELDEYVLDPIGMLFKIRTKDPWLYGQFENVCLFAAIDLIRRLIKDDLIDTKSLASASQIVRAFTFGINQYILEASWQKLNVNELGPHNVLPSMWTGSTEILMNYLKAGTRIGFGQCWCYGGLLTSLCRCIGIPCRTVTNYESAHDTNEDLTITLTYIDGKPSPDNRDSIWNFHVWNEVWMMRPSLEKSYNGWQVCDATHQHVSSESGRHQCGPFPVRALLYGNLKLPYDGVFIYGEINADVVDKFYRTDLLNRRITFVNETKSTASVGTKIVTNNPKMIEFAMNITNNYKYPEGSEDEREQHRRALESIGLRPRRYRRAEEELLETKSDMQFSIGGFEDVDISQSISGFLEMTNQSDNIRTVVSQIHVDIVCYTGTIIANAYTAHETLEIEPNKVRRMDINAVAESYNQNFEDDWDIAVSVFSKVQETGQNYRRREILKIMKPKLTIEMGPVLNLEREEQITVQLENPFDIPLNECQLKIDGTGFQFDKMPIECNMIDAHGTMVVKITTISRRRGLNQIIAVFSCAQVRNVRAIAAVRTT